MASVQMDWSPTWIRDTCELTHSNGVRTEQQGSDMNDKRIRFVTEDALAREKRNKYVGERPMETRVLMMV